jgi:hypothetical protein
VIDVREEDANGPVRIWVTTSLPARQGKKTDEGTMMLPPATKFNSTAVAVWPKTQTLTPATTEKASDILINCKIEFCVGTQKLRESVCPAKYRSLPAQRSYFVSFPVMFSSYTVCLSTRVPSLNVARPDDLQTDNWAND